MYCISFIRENAIEPRRTILRILVKSLWFFRKNRSFFWKSIVQLLIKPRFKSLNFYAIKCHTIAIRKFIIFLTFSIQIFTFSYFREIDRLPKRSFIISRTLKFSSHIKCSKNYIYKRVFSFNHLENLSHPIQHPSNRENGKLQSKRWSCNAILLLLSEKCILLTRYSRNLKSN